ncbi:uncharacterized protein LOC112455122 [Temnothorax curvispinosus]|uniref:Uncharacterized protein LOC112455122 n=1 Tax=Temnothorax curvispinosus TaxID=300111 RepID=A0A6J1PTJ8_9HYME|nr:uncharacterized protein LOC112455122 [Temnothorax curvispinosus]
MAYILNKAPVLCRSVFRKNIISGPVNKNTLVRSYEHLTNRTNKTNSWAEQKYKLKDNISDGYQLVYREHSTINGTIIAAYHIGWICFAAATFSSGYLMYVNPPVLKKGTSGILRTGYVLRPLTDVQRVLILFTSFAFSAILIVVSKGLPLRIYYSSKEKVYKAVFVNRIFGKKQIETFGEGTVVPVSNRKFLRDSFFKINNRIVLLDKECFPVPYVRERMLRKTE